MPFSKKKLFLRILVALVLLVTGTAGLLYVRLSDTETVKGMVLAELERIAGRNVTLESVEVDFEEEGLGLRLNNLVLLHRPEEPYQFSARSVWIGFRIIPFLTNEVSIRSMEVEGAVLEVVRNKEGMLSFQSTSQPASRPPGKDVVDVIWMSGIHELDFVDSTLRWVDHAVEQDGKPVILELQHADISLSRPLLATKLMIGLEGYWEGAQSVEPDLVVRAEVQFALGPSMGSALPYEGEFAVRRLSTHRLRPYWRRVLDVDLPPVGLQVQSRFSGTLGTILELTGTVEHRLPFEKGAPTLMAADHPAQGVLDYTLVWTPGALEIRNARYRANEYELQVQGALLPFPGANPRLAMKARTTPLTVEDVDRMFPFNLVPPAQRAAVQRHWKSGRVQVESLTYRGSWRDLTDGTSLGTAGDLNVVLQLEEVALQGLGPDVTRITGMADYREGRAALQWNTARVRNLPVNNIEATLTDLFTEPRLEGRLDLNAGLEELVRTLEDVLPPAVQSTLGKFKQLGGQTQTRLQFAGPVRNVRQWRLEGETVVQNGTLQAQKMMSPFTRIQGTLHFEHDSFGENLRAPLHVSFSGFSAECHNHRFEGFHGFSRIHEAGIQTEVQGRVELGVLESKQFVHPGAVGGEFGRFLDSVEVSHGVLEVDYREERFWSARKKPVLGGTVQVRNVALQYKNRFRPLREVTGQVTFDSEKIQFKTRHARYGDSAVDIHGNLLNAGTPEAELILKAVAPDFKNHDFAGIPFLESLDYRGTVQVESMLHWTPASVTLRNTVDLTRATYSYRDVLVKPKKVSNTIEMVVLFSEQGALDFKKLVVALGGNRVSGTGRLALEGEPQFHFDLEARRFKVPPMTPYIKPLRGILDGAVDFELSAKGRVGAPDATAYRGRIQLRNIVLKPEMLNGPLHLSGDVSLANRVVTVHKGRVDVGKNHLGVEGRYLVSDRPEWDVDVTSDELNLKDLAFAEIKGQGGAPAQGSWLAAVTGSPVFANGKGTVRVNIARLHLPRVRFQPFKGRFDFKEGMMVTDDLIVGDPGRDRFAANIKVQAQEDKAPFFSAHFISANTTPEGFFAIFGDQFDNCLTGRLERLEARLTARGYTLEDITRTLNGSLVLRVYNGRIHTGRLLNGTSLMFGYELDPQKARERRNEPFSDYKTIKGDFSIQNGIASTENFIFENPKQLVTLVGSFDLNAHTMDTVIGVAPWPAVDSFFKKIPLVGAIITGGTEESVFKNYFQVTGPFSDPQVKAIPFTSLGKKVVGMFDAILKTPQYIFSGGAESPGPN